MYAKKVSFAIAEPFLQRSLGDGRDELKHQCDNGISHCWSLANGQAYMLTRAEHKELVVCCFEGENLSDNITKLLIAAKQSGFESIRFHTKRPAILKLIKEPFEYVEHVFKRRL